MPTYPHASPGDIRSGGHFGHFLQANKITVTVPVEIRGPAVIYLAAPTTAEVVGVQGVSYDVTGFNSDRPEFTHTALEIHFTTNRPGLDMGWRLSFDMDNTTATWRTTRLEISFGEDLTSNVHKIVYSAKLTGSDLDGLGWNSSKRGYRCPRVVIPIGVQKRVELTNMRLVPYVEKGHNMTDDGEHMAWAT
jgi:hypothetical protein